MKIKAIPFSGDTVGDLIDLLKELPKDYKLIKAKSNCDSELIGVYLIEEENKVPIVMFM